MVHADVTALFNVVLGVPYTLSAAIRCPSAHPVSCHIDILLYRL